MPVYSLKKILVPSSSCHQDVEMTANDILNQKLADDFTSCSFATFFSEFVSYLSESEFIPSMAGGVPCKLLGASRLARLGYKPRIVERTGLVRSIKASCQLMLVDECQE